MIREHETLKKHWNGKSRYDKLVQAAAQQCKISQRSHLSGLGSGV